MIAQAIKLAWDLGDNGNVFLSFFSRPRVSQRIHKNKPYFCIALEGCTGHICYTEWPWTSLRWRNALYESYEITGRTFYQKLTFHLNDISFVKKNRRIPRQQTTLWPDCSSFARITTLEYPRKNKPAISLLINVSHMIFARNYSLIAADSHFTRLEILLVDLGVWMSSNLTSVK